jgi:hypothetical protein
MWIACSHMVIWNPSISSLRWDVLKSFSWLPPSIFLSISMHWKSIQQRFANHNILWKSQKQICPKPPHCVNYSQWSHTDYYTSITSPPWTSLMTAYMVIFRVSLSTAHSEMRVRPSRKEWNRTFRVRGYRRRLRQCGCGWAVGVNYGDGEEDYGSEEAWGGVWVRRELDRWQGCRFCINIAWIKHA